MKKLGVSLVAVLVSLPMMAHATGNTITLKGNPEGTITANNHVATTSYVQGAYNDLAGHINTNTDAITILNGNASTAGSVAYQIANATTGQVTTDGTQTLTNKTIDGDDNTIQDLSTSVFKSGVLVDSTAGIAVTTSASDSKLATEKAVAKAIESGTHTLTNKTIDADDNTISDLTTSNFKSGTVATSIGAAEGNGAATNTELATALAVRNAINTATTGQVTTDGTQTLTNKTIDADDNTISDLEADNFKTGVIVNSTTGIAVTSSASDTKLVSEKAIASKLDVASNGNYISAGVNVAGNLGALDTRAKTNADNISTNTTNIGTIGNLTTTATNLVGAINEVNSKVLTVYTTWDSNTTDTVALAVPAPAQGGEGE